MYIFRIIKLTAILATVFTLAACGKKPVQKTVDKEPVVQKVKVKKKKKAKPVEAVAPKDDDTSEKADKRFLSFDINTQEVAAGAVFGGSVDISVPFKNPFDTADISVELALQGTNNGVIVNIPMYYERGNSEKSTWAFATIMPKSGMYNYTISVRGNGQNFISPETSFKVSKGTGIGIYKISKKEPSHFYCKGSEDIRLIGVNFPLILMGDARAKALDELAAAGANTLRVELSAPTSLIIPSGTHAGKYNQPMLKNIEALFNAAAERGMKVIVCFASDSDFNQLYANSYFAKSGLAKTPDEFFSSPDAAKTYYELVKYLVYRFGSHKNIVAWEPFSGIDAMDISKIDVRASWLGAATSAVRDADPIGRRLIMLSAGTSSEFEYIWSGDSCAFVGFSLKSLKDFSQAAWEHSSFFSKRYKKPAGVISVDTGIGAPDDPSYSHLRNTMWAGLMTGSPIVPLADYKNVAQRKAAADAVAEVSAFANNFKMADASLEALRLPEKIVQTSSSADENTTIIFPAFAETFPDKESSNDLARLEMNVATGAISANTLPTVWKSEALINLNLANVTNAKSALEINVESVPASAEFELVALANDAEVFRTKISGAGAKVVREEKGVRTAYINRKISVPLNKGENNLTFQLMGANSSMKIGTLEISKSGSMRGVTSVKPFAVRDEKSGAIYMWLRRAGAESSTIAKYKLYSRGIPEMRPFEYLLKIDDNPSTQFSVTWWDTRAKKMIAEGVLKTNADSVLKLMTPPFRGDIACVIRKM